MKKSLSWCCLSELNNNTTITTTTTTTKSSCFISSSHSSTLLNNNDNQQIIQMKEEKIYSKSESYFIEKIHKMWSIDNVNNNQMCRFNKDVEVVNTSNANKSTFKNANNKPKKLNNNKVNKINVKNDKYNEDNSAATNVQIYCNSPPPPPSARSSYDFSPCGSSIDLAINCYHTNLPDGSVASCEDEVTIVKKSNPCHNGNKTVIVPMNRHDNQDEFCIALTIKMPNCSRCGGGETTTTNTTSQAAANREKAKQELMAREQERLEQIARERERQEEIARERARQEEMARERERERQEQLARERERQEQIARERARQEEIAKERARQEQLAKEKARQEQQMARERARQEQQLAREKARQEQQLAKERARQAEQESRMMQKSDCCDLDISISITHACCSPEMSQKTNSNPKKKPEAPPPPHPPPLNNNKRRSADFTNRNKNSPQLKNQAAANRGAQNGNKTRVMNPSRNPSNERDNLSNVNRQAGGGGGYSKNKPPDGVVKKTTSQPPIPTFDNYVKKKPSSGCFKCNNSESFSKHKHESSNNNRQTMNSNSGGVRVRRKPQLIVNNNYSSSSSEEGEEEDFKNCLNPLPIMILPTKKNVNNKSNLKMSPSISSVSLLPNQNKYNNKYYNNQEMIAENANCNKIIPSSTTSTTTTGGGADPKAIQILLKVVNINGGRLDDDDEDEEEDEDEEDEESSCTTEESEENIVYDESISTESTTEQQPEQQQQQTIKTKSCIPCELLSPVSTTTASTTSSLGNTCVRIITGNSPCPPNNEQQHYHHLHLHHHHQQQQQQKSAPPPPPQPPPPPAATVTKLTNKSQPIKNGSHLNDHLDEMLTNVIIKLFLENQCKKQVEESSPQLPPGYYCQQSIPCVKTINKSKCHQTQPLCVQFYSINPTSPIQPNSESSEISEICNYKTDKSNCVKVLLHRSYSPREEVESIKKISPINKCQEFCNADFLCEPGLSVAMSMPKCDFDFGLRLMIEMPLRFYCNYEADEEAEQEEIELEEEAYEEEEEENNFVSCPRGCYIGIDKNRTLTKLTISSIMKMTPSFDEKKTILQGRKRPYVWRTLADA